MYPDVWECINDCAILDGPAGRKSVNRGVSEVTQGTAQTNGIESLCAMLKYSDQGTYRKMSAKHFGRYANERSDHSLVRMPDTLASQELTPCRMSRMRPRCRDHVESNAGQAGERAMTA